MRNPKLASSPLVLVAIAGLFGLPIPATAGFSLGVAGQFAVLAGASVTNTGASIIDGGNVGVVTNSGITGFPPGVLASPFSMHVADSLAVQAHADLVTAFGASASLVSMSNLTGLDLGGMVLTPGVYTFASSAQLTGRLTLNDLGDPNALFVFQIGSTLTTATNASVVTINGGRAPGSNVFWEVGSSATIDTGSAFKGHILALTDITMNKGATILDGSAMAINGSVTLDSNQITNSIGSVPEPGSVTLVLLGVAIAWAGKRGLSRA